MGRNPAHLVRKTWTIAAGTAMIIYLPTLATITIGVATTLITLLALIAALATGATRRDAAHTTLTLLLHFLRPQEWTSAEARSAKKPFD